MKSRPTFQRNYTTALRVVCFHYLKSDNLHSTTELGTGLAAVGFLSFVVFSTKFKISTKRRETTEFDPKCWDNIPEIRKEKQNRVKPEVSQVPLTLIYLCNKNAPDWATGCLWTWTTFQCKLTRVHHMSRIHTSSTFSWQIPTTAR